MLPWLLNVYNVKNKKENTPYFPGFEKYFAKAIWIAMNSIAAVALLLFGKVGDHAVGREEEPGDGRGVLERRASPVHKLPRIKPEQKFAV